MPQGIVVLLVVAAFAGFAYVAYHLERQKLLELSSAFETGAEIVGFMPPRLVGRHSGYRVEYRVLKHHHRHRHGFRHHSHTRGHSLVTLRTSGGPTWTAAPEGLGTSLLKGLGVMSDIELGVEDLDRRLRFSAKAPRRLPDMLRRSEAQEPLRTLTNHPRFLGLRCTDSLVEARYTVDPSADYDDRELLHRLEPLVELAKGTGARPAV
jgi:hypothetical protein